MEVSDEVRAEARAMFDKYDKDASGSLDRKEIRKVLLKMDKGLESDSPVMQAMVDQLIKQADTDMSGVLEFEEFIGVYARLAHKKAMLKAARREDRANQAKAGQRRASEAEEEEEMIKRNLEALAAAKAAKGKAGGGGSAKAGTTDADLAAAREAAIQYEFDVKRAREAFERHDVDRSGSISKGELAALLKDLGKTVSDDRLDQLYNAADADMLGQISLGEFVDIWNTLHTLA